jgi:hypothetical protein
MHNLKPWRGALWRASRTMTGVLPAMQGILRRQRFFVCTIGEGLVMARPARVRRLLTTWEKYAFLHVNRRFSGFDGCASEDYVIPS